MLGHKRLDLRAVAEEQERRVGTARQRQFGAGDYHGRAMVSSHRIKSNADQLRHCLIAILDRDPSQLARIAVPILVIAHDPFRKPESTFRNRAPGPNKGAVKAAGE
jgi:hypothetical protein